MQRGAIVRGRLHGRVIELEEPLGDGEKGEVEVQIRSVLGVATRHPDLLDVIATSPEGHRAKADIDQRLADERSGWTDGS